MESWRFSSLRHERRAVRRVKEGTVVALVQSGLQEECWHCAMERCCYLRIVHDKMADDKTAFEKRYGQKFDGPTQREEKQKIRGPSVENLSIDIMKNVVWCFTTKIMKQLPIPLKYVNVMRQTQTSVNNVSSENIINDLWTKAKGVTLSEEWTETAIFQILRTRLLEGHKWVNGTPTTIQNTTRRHSFWPEVFG